MKVRCIKSCNNWFIAGKIYEVKNNYLTDEEKYNWTFQNLKYFNNKLMGLVKFELVKEETMKLSDIKERYLVVFANGEEAMFSGKCFEDMENHKFNRSSCKNFRDFNEDLTHKTNYNYDIVEVHKPHYSKVWTRPVETVKELTLAEIEDKFGCKVKIVKENK